MEAHELANKLRNNPNNELSYVEDVIKWCDENAEKLNLSNPDEMFLCEKAIKHLMENKGNRAWSNDNARYITSFLAKKTLKELDLDQTSGIQILDEDEYEKMYGNRNSIVRGVCIPQADDYFKIAYFPEVIKDLTSENKERFLNGLQTIYHEIRHAQQNKSISRETREDGTKLTKNKERYLSALETVARKLDEPFYKANYGHLLKENDAEKYGLIKAYTSIKEYAPDLCKKYSFKQIQDRLQEYDKNYYEALSSMIGNSNYSLKKEIDTRASKFIEQNPEMVKMYPILQVGFHEDGTKKDIIELLQDRKNILNSGENLDVTNELYEIVANHRNVTIGGLKGTKDEISKLDEYIKQNGIEDGFAYNLAQYRLGKIRQQIESKTNLTQEQIDNFLKQEYPTISKFCQEKEEQESIKDEIGDEFKPKTEQQKQEEQQVETMWKEKFQSWDRDAINLPNSAKRKEEAVKLIQNIQKQKEQQTQEKEDVNR